jgi:hypothetical protein
MKMLLKKGDVAKQLNDLKQSIKMSIASINYDFEVFLIKIKYLLFQTIWIFHVEVLFMKK